MPPRLWVIILTGVIGCGRSTEPTPPVLPPAPLPAEKPIFSFPTKNRTLLHSGEETKFFAPTGPGRPWNSGAFGCVRNTRTRIHEGIDIRALHRDNRNEPTDLVQAARNGVVTHINSNVAASSYGKYIVLRHAIEGLQVYSLYAHLSEIAEGLQVDQSVTGGDTLGILR